MATSNDPGEVKTQAHPEVLRDDLGEMKTQAHPEVLRNDPGEMKTQAHPEVLRNDPGEMNTRDLLEVLHASCFGWAMTCCNFDRDEALDVLQTAYLKVLEGESRFNGQSSHKTWLFGIIRWTATCRRRRRLLRALLLEHWARRQVPPQASPTLDTAADADDEARRVRAMLTRLPGRQRQVLHLVFYEETTIEEASSILGISVGSARVHYHRGKAALRAMLVTHPEDGMESAHERA